MKRWLLNLAWGLSFETSAIYLFAKLNLHTFKLLWKNHIAIPAPEGENI